MLKFLAGLLIGASITFAAMNAYQAGGLNTTALTDKDKALELESRVRSLIEQAVEFIQSTLSGEPFDLFSDEAVQLRRVIDGDTIEVSINGRSERIRYIGANTPERDDPCYQEALQENRKILSTGPLRLDTDATDKDRYGRLLRYVYAGDVLVELELIARGYAEVVRYRSDDKHYDEFRRLEIEAARQGLGCHPSGIFDDGSLTR